MIKLKELWSTQRDKYLMHNEKFSYLLFKGIYLTKRITKTYEKDKARRARSKDVELRALLATTQLDLQGDPQALLQDKVEEAKGQLNNFWELQTSTYMDVGYDAKGVAEK